MKPLSIYIGFDAREASAFAVAKHSAITRTRAPIPVRGIVLNELRRAGMYYRPTTVVVDANAGYRRLWDQISDAPMATEFAISRFFTPLLAKRGWAMFMDCDMLVRHSLTDLFEQADSTKAIMCVKHEFHPPEGVKMDGQAQLPYPRKNWSSVMLFNCDHPANAALTVDMLNTVPGRDLHGFCWLKDDQIGELSPTWNYLVGHTPTMADPSIVHFTDGIPAMEGYSDVEFANEWNEELADWASARAWD